jgi:methyl-accepting chemotaxis protein
MFNSGPAAFWWPKKIASGLARSLAFKLILPGALVTVASCFFLSMLASAQADKNLTAAFESKGEAIALSLSATAEQAVGGNLSTLQGAIDSYKTIADVRYVFVEDTDKSILVHTFTPQFPKGLEKLNQFEPDDLASGRRIKVARKLEFAIAGGLIESIDVAAPVAGGALGTVHVGMDRNNIARAVGSLRRRMLLWGSLIALVGVAVSIVVATLFVVRPVSRLTKVTRQVVERGDLTLLIEAGAQDEIGDLAAAFREMVANLREAIGGLKDSSSALDRSMGELSSSTDQQTATVTRQASALQETQVTAQEIKQTSQLAADKAREVLEEAEKAETLFSSGETAIERSLAGLTDIRFQVEQIAIKIAELSDGARQVAGITETVKDLADQSNMLALNAAIEAVRSGEHGKGFAVVAREIRSLADQSIEATRRVREVLGDIGRRVRDVVAITQAGAQRIDAGLEQVRSSGESMRQLSGIVKNSSAQVRQIAAAVSQQNLGITQIFAAVSDLSSMMEATLQRLDETSAAAGQLRSASGRASSVVKGYTV